MAELIRGMMTPQGEMVRSEQQHKFDVGFWEGAKANFLRNPISMSIMTERTPLSAKSFDPDFDAKEFVEPKYDMIRSDILSSASEEEVTTHKKNFDMFAENAMIANEAGVLSAMVGEVGAYGVDPVAWAGLGATSAVFKALKIESRLATRKGLRRIIENTGHGFGTEAAHQALLLHMDTQMTSDEAFVNVFAGTVFGTGITALGVGAAKLNKALPASKRREGRAAVLNAINNSEDELSFEKQAENGEINNAHRWKPTVIDGKEYTTPEELVVDLKSDLEDYAAMDGEHDLPFVSVRNSKNQNLAETIVDVPADHRPAKVALLEKIMDKYISLTTPGLRFAYSVLPETKEIGDMLRRTALLDNQNFHGNKSKQSAESRSDVFHIEELKKSLMGMNDDYDAYRLEATGSKVPKMFRGVVGAADTVRAKIKGGADFLTEGEFVRNVSKALLNGESHPNPHVESAAKRIREVILEPNFQRMKKLGMVDEKLLGERFNKSHLPRLWLSNIVRGKEGDLVDLIFGWQKDNLPAARQKTKKQLLSAIKEIYNDPLGLDRMDGKKPKKTYKGFFKQRTIEMDDNILMDGGFIEGDVRTIISNYTHSVRTDMALVEQFGSVGMEKQIEKIAKGWAKLRAQARAAGGSNDLMEKMLKTEKREIRDVEAVRDIQRGVYKIPEDPYGIKSTVLRVALDMNNTIMLGGVTVSSFPDISRTFYANGIESSLGASKAMFLNREIFKMGLQDVHRAGVAMDALLNMVSMQYMFMDSPAFTKYDRMSKAMSSAFFKATMLPQWNDFIKGVTGIISASKMIDDMIKWVDADSISKADDSVVYINGNNNKFIKNKDGSQGAYIPATAREKIDANGNEYFEITVDEEFLRNDFVNKPWRDINGADALSDDHFRSSTDWVEFVKRHEYWHTITKREGKESVKDLENRINQLALGPASRERVRLLNGGIDLEDARRIVAMFNEHGDTIDGVRIANTSDWHKTASPEPKSKPKPKKVQPKRESRLADDADSYDEYEEIITLDGRSDAELRDLGEPTTLDEFTEYKERQLDDVIDEEPDFEPDSQSLATEKTFLAALNREVNNSIVTPGSADKPLWMHHEWGKLVGQYKSFIMAATEKIALSGLQYRDKRALQAAVVSVMIGSQVSAMKDHLRGSKPPDNILGSILDGIDQSGITGWAFTAQNAFETLSGNNIGLRSFTGNQNPWTPSVKHIVGQIGGPTAGNVASAISIGADVATGSVDRNTMRSAGKFVMGHNLPYVQVLRMAEIPDMFDALKGAGRQ